jgi:hypothetical protein
VSGNPAAERRTPMIDALLDYYELALWILLCPVPIAVGIWSLFDKENR